MTELAPGLSAADLAELDAASKRRVPVSGELADDRTPAEWGELVRSDLARSVQGFVDAGRHLAEAKAALPHGEWLPWIERELPIGERAVSMLMRIAKHRTLSNQIHGSDLPASLRTLDSLAQLDPSALESAIANGRVTPELERKQAKALVAEYRASSNGAPDTQTASEPVPPLAGQVSTIVADPPWRYGNTSTRGAAADHYPTMSIEELCALELPHQRAGENAHLYLWTTAGHLPEAFTVMSAWGFTYKTYLVWVKPQIGMGNYFRLCTELVLFGVRGSLRTNDRALRNWFESPRGQHSAKPPQFADLVTRASPGPYLEMFARCNRHKMLDGMCECTGCRLGWEVWGNQT